MTRCWIHTHPADIAAPYRVNKLFSCLNFFWVHALYTVLSFRLVCRGTTTTHALKHLALCFYSRKYLGTFLCTKIRVTNLIFQSSARSCRKQDDFESSGIRNLRGWCVFTSSLVFLLFFFFLFSQLYKLDFNYRTRTSDSTNIWHSFLNYSLHTLIS